MGIKETWILLILVGSFIYVGCSTSENSANKKDSIENSFDKLYYSEPNIKDTLKLDLTNDDLTNSCSLFKLKKYYNNNEMGIYEDFNIDEDTSVTFVFHVAIEEKKGFVDQNVLEISVAKEVSRLDLTIISLYIYTPVTKTISLRNVAFITSDYVTSIPQRIVNEELFPSESDLRRQLDDLNIRNQNQNAIDSVIEEISQCDEMKEEYFKIDWELIKYKEFED